MTTNITDHLRDVFIPKAALIVYENQNGERYSNEKRRYLETRPVKEDGSLGCAKPVSKKFIHALVDAFRREGERIPHGPMPQNILYANPALGTECYVWWNPPRKRKMYFTKDIPMDEAEYNVPGTIYKACGDSLQVYCFKGKRPKPGDALLYGPFYNYYGHGGICLGSAKLDWPGNVTWQTVLDHWERIFWDSENSHMMHNPCKKGHNLNLALKDALDNPFDTDILLDTGKKVSSLLK
jgi:PRTRC genetic system protein B